MHGMWLKISSSTVFGFAKISRIFAFLDVQNFCYFRCMNINTKNIVHCVYINRWHSLIDSDLYMKILFKI